MTDYGLSQKRTDSVRTPNQSRSALERGLCRIVTTSDTLNVLARMYNS